MVYWISRIMFVGLFLCNPIGAVAHETAKTPLPCPRSGPKSLDSRLRVLPLSRTYRETLLAALRLSTPPRIPAESRGTVAAFLRKFQDPAVTEMTAREFFDDAVVMEKPAENLHDPTGDFYYMLNLPDGRVSIYFGDGLEHGVSAAMMSLQMHLAMRDHPLGLDLRTVKNSAEGLVLIDQGFHWSANDFPGMVLGHLLYDPKTRLLDWTGSGMGPIYVLKADGSVHVIRSNGYFLGDPDSAGFSPDITSPHLMTLESGDVILLLSDGITESPLIGTTEKNGVALELPRLLESQGRSTSAPRDLKNLRDAIIRVQGTNIDDQTMILLRVR